jgi:hypothetical protein
MLTRLRARPGPLSPVRLAAASSWPARLLVVAAVVLVRASPAL